MLSMTLKQKKFHSRVKCPRAFREYDVGNKNEKSLAIVGDRKSFVLFVCQLICLQTGDFAAVSVKVSPTCGCQRNLELNWVLMRDDQFVAWGNQPPQEENGECVYRFGYVI